RPTASGGRGERQVPPVLTGLVAWAVALAPLASVARYARGMPVGVLVGTVLPGLGYVALLLWIARAVRVRLGSAVVAFALVWGAGVSAPAASLANALIQARSGLAGWSLALVGVPPVEEAAKAAVLVALVLVWRTAAHDVRAGIVVGGLVGV